MKKRLCILLVLTMIFSCSPLFAFAEDEGFVDQKSAPEESIESSDDSALPAETDSLEAAAMADESTAGEGPVIDEFNNENEIIVFYDESDPWETSHYVDGVLSTSFRLDGSSVYCVSTYAWDPNDDEISYPAETTIKLNGSNVLVSGDPDFCQTWYAGAFGQAGDIMTVSLRKNTDKVVDNVIFVNKFKPMNGSLLPKSLSVSKGKTKYDIDPTEPNESSNDYYYVDYTIDDESIADLKAVYSDRKVELNIKGKNPGKAVITATLPNGKTYKCNLTVTAGLKYTSKTIRIKESFKNELDGYSGKVTWTSSNKKVATVSSKGVIKGIKKGKATITAKAGGKTYKCTVTVKNPVLSDSYISPTVGQTYQLSVKGGSGKIKWTSSNKKVATVSSKGIVTAKKEGSCKITATRNGFKMRCEVDVVTTMELSNSSINLFIGADGIPETTYLFAEGGSGDVTWTVDDESIVTIKKDGGDDFCLVRPVGVGSTTIWAERDGYTANCFVTVESFDNIVYLEDVDTDSYDVYYDSDGWYVKTEPLFTGYIKVKCNSGTGYVHIEDENFRPISEDIYIAEDDPYAYFGVKDTESYYLVFTDCAESLLPDEYGNYVDNPDGLRNVSISNVAVNNKCGYSRSKAKKIAKKKVVKGVVYSGDKRSHWYKITLTKKSNIHIKFDNKIHQAGEITVYKGSKKARGGGPYWVDYDEVQNLWTTKKFPKGTYYIRIQPDTDYKGTGWYTVKWW